MSSTPLVVREVHQPPPQPGEHSAPLQRPSEPCATEAAYSNQPRDVLELMLLHGDCAFLLDLWAL
jgi:hypothetical protein